MPTEESVILSAGLAFHRPLLCAGPIPAGSAFNITSRRSTGIRGCATSESFDNATMSQVGNGRVSIASQSGVGLVFPQFRRDRMCEAGFTASGLPSVWTGVPKRDRARYASSVEDRKGTELCRMHPCAFSQRAHANGRHPLSYAPHWAWQRAPLRTTTPQMRNSQCPPPPQPCLSPRMHLPPPPP